MKRIKIIQKNRKAQFMIVSTILFGFLMLVFGLCMLFSPFLKYSDNEGQNIFVLLRNFFTRELYPPNYLPEDETVWKLVTWLPFLATDSETNSVVFLPTKMTIIWLPIIIGGTSVFVMICRAITHAVGYKPLNKKGLSKIVRPIRSYQCTLTLAWVFLFLLIFTALISFCCVSPFSVGGFVTISLKGSFSIEAGDMEVEYNNIEGFLVGTGVFKKFYWLSMILFSKSWYAKTEIYFIGVAVVESSKLLVFGFIILPLLPVIAFGVTNLVGTICGSCSWGTINAIVLAAITGEVSEELKHTSPAPTAQESALSAMKKESNTPVREVQATASVKAELTAPQPVKEKTITREFGPNKINDTFKPKCLAFYEDLKVMLVNANLTWAPLFKVAEEKIKTYIEIASDKIDWGQEINAIEATINEVVGKDPKFILLLEKMLSDSRIEIFGSNQSNLIELINTYNQAFVDWNLQLMEETIEKIYLISFNYEELYGKVGYCIRTKLISNFAELEKHFQVLERLEDAKENEDYYQYREICLETIMQISPNKKVFASSINEFIYN